MNDTPQSNRLHIALAGDRNAGKSTLFNALLGQDAALVSPVAGTTTDVVAKAMELHPVGPVLLLDTGGLDDSGALGEARVAKTRQALTKADLVLVVTREGQTPPPELQTLKTPHLFVINTDGKPTHTDGAVCVNARTGEGMDALRAAIAAALPQSAEPSLTAHLTQPGDLVLLVMPQDKQAPKGRLILPQQQTLRDLLDNGCIALCTTLEALPSALASLLQPPSLVITDSQVFRAVKDALPPSVRLTSFSMLQARVKGDIELFKAGAQAIDSLKPNDRVLIAEACSHNPQDGDIGRQKIPALLNKAVGGALRFDFATGSDFPADLSVYQLVVQCGGCMFNRKHMLSRLQTLAAQGVPVTNYGVCIAKLQGILDQTVI